MGLAGLIRHSEDLVCTEFHQPFPPEDSTESVQVAFLAQISAENVQFDRSPGIEPRSDWISFLPRLDPGIMGAHKCTHARKACHSVFEARTVC